MCEPWKPRNFTPCVKRIAGTLGVPSYSEVGEGLCQHRCLELSMLKSPGSVEDGMLGRNEQRKPGTTRGSPRRSRTAKASRISAMRRNRDVPASGADGVD
jgi:hypothetical protein